MQSSSLATTTIALRRTPRVLGAHAPIDKLCEAGRRVLLDTLDCPAFPGCYINDGTKGNVGAPSQLSTTALSASLLCFADTNNCKLINHASTADDSIPIYGWLFEKPVLAVGDGPGEALGNYGTKYWFERFEAQNCEIRLQEGGGSASSSSSYSNARHKPARSLIIVGAVAHQGSGTETSGSDEDDDTTDAPEIGPDPDGPERAAVSAASATGAAERLARVAHRTVVRAATVFHEAGAPGIAVPGDEHSGATAHAIPVGGVRTNGSADFESDAHAEEPCYHGQADFRPGFVLARTRFSTGVITDATQDLLQQLYVVLSGPTLARRNSSDCVSSDPELSERLILHQDMETSEALERIFSDLYSSQQRTTALFRAREEVMAGLANISYDPGDSEHGQDGVLNPGLDELGQEQEHDTSSACNSDRATGSALARIQRETGCLNGDSMTVVTRIMNAHAIRYQMPYMSITPDYAQRFKFACFNSYLIIVLYLFCLF